jgi:hypothetical protein
LTLAEHALQVATVRTDDGSLLRAARGAASHEDVLLCVAFARVGGVQLLAKELKRANRRRLLATTVFGGSEAALAEARDLGVEVRIRNPSSGTYHPKLYLGVTAEHASALVCSANLTGGLLVNVELGTELRGSVDALPVAEARAWAEAEWDRGEVWRGPYTVERETLDAALYERILVAHRQSPVFLTLGKAAENLVREVTPSALYVDTERSRARGKPEPIPAWMLNLAWEVLQARGTLDNGTLLDELRVHRSSAVLAILARLPGVEPLKGRRIGVRCVGSG